MLWLDAGNVDETNNSTLSDGDSVSTWKDLSDNGSDLSHVIGNIPTLDKINQKIIFDYGSLKTTQSTSISAGPQSYIAVVRNRSSGSAQSGIHGIVTHNGFAGIYATHQFFIVDGAGASENYSANTSTAPDQWSVLVGLYSENRTRGTKIYMNGELAEEYTANGVNISNGSVLEVGGRTTSGLNDRVFAGDIREIMIFERQLNDQEVRQINYYLSQKWGLNSSVDSDDDGVADLADGAPLDPTQAPAVNTAPYDLNSTAPLSINENQAVGTYIGDFNATDPDVNSSLTYHLVSGAGDSGNQYFTLEANGTLKSATVFDFESNVSTFHIRAQAKDEYNASVDANFTVTLTDDPMEDTDGDGFTDAQEISAGTAINDSNSTPGLDFGMVGYWPFDGNASDLSGNGNHGTIHGAVPGMDRYGRANKSYSFNGTNNYIEVPYFADLSSPQFSFSLWVHASALTSVHGSPITSRNTPESGYILYKIPQNQWAFWTGNGNRWKATSIGGVTVNEWESIVCVHNGSNMLAYRAGIEVGSLATTFAANTLKPFRIGAGKTESASPDFYFNGLIDDVRVYNRALSASEVLSLYNLEKPKTKLIDSNFQTAVNLWFSNQADANATYGHIRDWNVSAVTNMSNTFKFRNGFNEDITGWNVSSVTNMSGMFWDAYAFNQSIGVWDLSSLTDMSFMFQTAASFNQPIGNWNVSSVTNMFSTFNRAYAFNQDIGDWNVSSVTSMDSTFYSVSAFNQNIRDWDVSSVTNMNSIFYNAGALSNSNKGQIHLSFSSNLNWTTDWAVYVPVTYQSPSGGYQTPEGNYSSPDTGYQSPSGDYSSPTTGYQSPTTDYHTPEGN